MKDLSDQEKADIHENCKKATLLIEKQHLEGITPTEKSELEYHLSLCEMCNTFMEQSAAINQMVKQLFHPGKNELKLEDEFKKLLQQKIDAKLDQSSNE